MSTRTISTGEEQRIESREQLVAPMQEGEKAPDRWRIGTEHEKLVYKTGDHRAPSYDERGGIRDILLEMQEFGWRPVEEGGKVIAMAGDDGTVSLEPAGQLELSGAAVENLHQTCAETGRHLHQVKAIGERCGVGFLGLGMWPDKTREVLPIMPKGRYEIMLRHMPRVGSMGLDMMLRTCTIQVNLDYCSEANMAKKFRTSLALQPLATALFANSPFTEGKPNGYLSYRSHIWSDTDPHRTGMLPFVFEDGFGYERYVDYILDMRGADGGPWNRICALPALWVGLLYDDAALDAAWDLVRHWTMDEREALRDAVPRLALDAPIPGGGKLLDLAREVLPIARAGLSARARLSTSGDNESGFLEPLEEIVDSGKVPAQRLLDKFNGEWAGDMSRVY